MAPSGPFARPDGVANPSGGFHPPAAAPQSGHDAVSDERGPKARSILRACRINDVDALVSLATSAAGLVDDELRRVAWPILLGLHHGVSESAPRASDDDSRPWSNLEPYHDEEQVQKDVDRSFVYYPTSQSDQELQGRRQELSALILTVLRRHPYLHYFQGYHDIVQVLLLVLGPADAVPAVERLSLLRIRDFMLPSISAAIPHLNLIPAIIRSADRDLYAHLTPTDPFYALSATLTLYAHNIEAYSDIARLFDFLLAHDATTPIYFFVATILLRRDELLEIDARHEPEILQFTIQKLPNPLDMEGLIVQTVDLMKRFPPEKLPSNAWKRVSRYSVLKTTRDADRLRLMTLVEAKELFDKQARELAWQQMVGTAMKNVHSFTRRNRRPATLVALSVVLGLASVWLARDEQRLKASMSLYRSLVGGLRQRVAYLLG